MANLVQRDFIVEANDQLIVKDDAALRSIVNRLMPTATLRISDVASALSVSVQQVHNWIDLGKFKCLKIGCGDGRQHRRIIRESFIEFIRNSVA